MDMASIAEILRKQIPGHLVTFRWQQKSLHEN